MTEWNSSSDRRVSNTSSPSKARGNICSNNMKAVLFVVATLMAVNIHAQDCNVPTYDSCISPVECIEGHSTLLLPNYENVSSYYKCENKTIYLQTCETGTYFSYVYQGCRSCNQYIPSVRCSGLPINVTCQPISGSQETSTQAPTTSSSSTTTTTTTTTTKTTTAAPGDSSISTTTGTITTTPHPPTAADETTSTTASGGDDGVVTPSGTTIAVPGPPSPGGADVPSPETPVPTAPIIDDQPPTPAATA